MPFKRPNGKSIDKVFNAIANISGLTESMLALCLRNCCNHDAGYLSDLKMRCQQVKHDRNTVDKNIARICSEAALPADSVRRVIALGHVALELENIAILTMKLATPDLTADGVDYDEYLRATSSMGKLVKTQLKTALDALLTTDSQKALLAQLSSEDIHEMHMSLLKEHLTLVSANMRSANLGAHILHVSKNLEKISDCTNKITEFAYEISTGSALRAKSNRLHARQPMHEMAS